jgi:hypothetical protein
MPSILLLPTYVAAPKGFDRQYPSENYLEIWLKFFAKILA